MPDGDAVSVTPRGRDGLALAAQPALYKQLLQATLKCEDALLHTLGTLPATSYLDADSQRVGLQLFTCVN